MTQTHAPNETKLNTRDLAAHLRVTPRCIQNWRDAGKIPFVRITARCIRYNLAEVEQAIRHPKASS